MREELIRKGFIRAMAPEDRKALLQLGYKLKEEGHAITLGITEEGSKVVSAEVHHYKTCRMCVLLAKGEQDSKEMEGKV